MVGVIAQKLCCKVSYMHINLEIAYEATYVKIKVTVTKNRKKMSSKVGIELNINLEVAHMQT